MELAGLLVDMGALQADCGGGTAVTLVGCDKLGTPEKQPTSPRTATGI